MHFKSELLHLFAALGRLNEQSVDILQQEHSCYALLLWVCRYVIVRGPNRPILTSFHLTPAGSGDLAHTASSLDVRSPTEELFLSDSISKTRKNVHLANSGVHNLELSSYRSVGDSQDATMAMQNRVWFQEIPPNYSPTQRGTIRSKNSRIQCLCCANCPSYKSEFG